MKKFILFIVIIIILVAIVFGYGNIDTKDDLDTVNELFESMDEIDYDTMICTKKDGTIFSEQVIEIKFNADNIVSEVLINEKYSTKEAAETSYNSMIADGIYEEILLDGNVITYNATSSFEYEGKTKEEMLNIMNNFEHDGINSGYSITWK